MDSKKNIELFDVPRGIGKTSVLIEVAVEYELGGKKVGFVTLKESQIHGIKKSIERKLQMLGIPLFISHTNQVNGIKFGTSSSKTILQAYDVIILDKFYYMDSEFIDEACIISDKVQGLTTSPYQEKMERFKQETISFPSF